MSVQEKFISLAQFPTTFKRLHPAVVKPFIDAAGRCAQAFIDNPADETLLHFLALPKIGLAQGLRARNAALRLRCFPNLEWPDPDSTTRMHRNPVDLATRLIENGRLAAAASALDDETPIAPLDEDTIEELREKHPQGPKDPFEKRSRRAVPPGPAPDGDTIQAALSSFRNDTAPGISGWTVALLRLAYRDERVVKMVSVLTAMMMNNTAPGHDLLCAARLTALRKVPTGVRPIAVGDLLYRLCAKAILKTLFKTDFLSSQQFGVGTKGGIEPITRILQLASEGGLEEQYTHALMLDSRNAFNEMDRTVIAEGTLSHAPGLFLAAKWIYGSPSTLVMRENSRMVEIESSQGVRQGDPLGPLLFSLGLRDTIEGLQTALGDRYLVLAYLDDIVILGPDGDLLDTVAPLLGSLKAPITLNPAKCHTVPLSAVREEGLEVLGTMVGAGNSQAEFLASRIPAFKQSIRRLRHLPSQHALLLLRFCLLPRLRHLTRTLLPEAVSHVWDEVDEVVRLEVDRLRWAETTQDRESLDNVLISLPGKLGGLGLTSFADISPLAHRAATASADTVLSSFITAVPCPTSTPTQRELCLEMFAEQRNIILDSLERPERAMLIEHSSQIGRRWLSMIPGIPKLRLADEEVASALRARTLMDPSSPVCLRCGHEHPTLAHADNCNSMKGSRMRRHEIVKYALGSALKSTPGGVVDYEPLIAQQPPQTAGDNMVRYNDVRFHGTNDFSLPPMEFDVKVTSVATKGANQLPQYLDYHNPDDPADEAETRVNRYLARQAEAKTKNLPALRIPGATFHPIIISAGGMMEKETLEVFQRLNKNLPPGVYSLMIQTISAGLLRQRAKAMRTTDGPRSAGSLLRSRPRRALRGARASDGEESERLDERDGDEDQGLDDLGHEVDALLAAGARAAEGIGGVGEMDEDEDRIETEQEMDFEAAGPGSPGAE